MLAHLHKTELSLPFRREMLKAGYAKDIFRLSAPNSLQQASGTIITTVKQGLLGGLGVAAIAGFSCAGKLSSLLMMPVYGFVQSIVFFIAQNTTAQQPDRVHTGLREGRRILFFYSLLVAALCIGLNGPLLRLFTTDAAAAAYRAEAPVRGPAARCPEDGAVSGLEPGADRAESGRLRSAGAPHRLFGLLAVHLDQRPRRPCVGRAAGKDRRKTTELTQKAQCLYCAFIYDILFLQPSG